MVYIEVKNNILIDIFSDTFRTPDNNCYLVDKRDIRYPRNNIKEILGIPKILDEYNAPYYFKNRQIFNSRGKLISKILIYR